MPGRFLWPYDTFDETAPLISRFSIMLFSSILLGMTVGYVLPSQIRILTGSAGAVGVLFYLYRIWLIREEYAATQSFLRQRAEDRLEAFAIPRPRILPAAGSAERPIEMHRRR